jgi:transposase
MICLMARKNYSEEFRRQAVQLYESTPGATFKAIAVDLGISRGALAGWVRMLGTDPAGSDTAPAGEAEAARVVQAGGQIFRWRDELVSRFQFVADHQDTFEVKRLCEVIEVNRSSFYAWVNAAAGLRHVRTPMRSWPPGSARFTPKTPLRARPGSPLTSTTGACPASGSTINGWPG